MKTTTVLDHCFSLTERNDFWQLISLSPTQTVLIKTGKVPSGPLISCCLLDYVPAESLPTAEEFP